MEQDWRPVVGYEGLYEVSSDGLIKSLIRGLVLKSKKESNGYHRVMLYKDKCGKSISVHKIVAEAFIGPCEKGLQVNHIDGCKDNNSFTNLEYCTCSENIKHAYELGLKENCRIRGKEMAKANATKLAAYRDRVKKPVISFNLQTSEMAVHESVNAAARETGSEAANVSRVLKGVYKQTHGYTFKYKEE